MSERKTRKPKANAKRPAGARPPGAKPPGKTRSAKRSAGASKANRPKGTKPKGAPVSRTRATANSAGGKRVAQARPASPKAKAKAKANAPKKTGPSKPKPSKTRSADKKPARTLLGQPRPAPRRTTPKRTGPDARQWIAQHLGIAAKKGRELWTKVSPKAKAGAAATATATARLARSSGSGLVKGLGHAGRFASKHRLTALQVLHRVAWWGAWAMLLIAGRDLVAFEQVGRLPVEQTTFLWGLGLCAFVVATAGQRRMRTGALALGGAHALAAAILIAG